MDKISLIFFILWLILWKQLFSGEQKYSITTCLSINRCLRVLVQRILTSLFLLTIILSRSITWTEVVYKVPSNEVSSSSQNLTVTISYIFRWVEVVRPPNEWKVWFFINISVRSIRLLTFWGEVKLSARGSEWCNLGRCCSGILNVAGGGGPLMKCNYVSSRALLDFVVRVISSPEFHLISSCNMSSSFYLKISASMPQYISLIA